MVLVNPDGAGSISGKLHASLINVGTTQSDITSTDYIDTVITGTLATSVNCTILVIAVTPISSSAGGGSLARITIGGAVQGGTMSADNVAEKVPLTMIASQTDVASGNIVCTLQAANTTAAKTTTVGDTARAWVMMIFAFAT